MITSSFPLSGHTFGRSESAKVMGWHCDRSGGNRNTRMEHVEAIDAFLGRYRAQSSRLGLARDQPGPGKPRNDAITFTSHSRDSAANCCRL